MFEFFSFEGVFSKCQNEFCAMKGQANWVDSVIWIIEHILETKLADLV